MYRPWPVTIGGGESRCHAYEGTKALMVAILYSRRDTEALVELFRASR